MRRERWAVAVAATVLLGGGAPLRAQLGECASTPAAAVKAAALTGSEKLANGEKKTSAVGYRVESVRWDAMQRQTWAVIRSCDHAERPALAMLTDLPQAGLPRRMSALAPIAVVEAVLPAIGTVSARIAVENGAATAVHAGEAVRLWKADEQAHIELTGLAEENGAVGGRVRVRLAMSRGLNGQSGDGQSAPPPVLMGVVRGPADVEIER